jgi:hypothetical protein|tara:strand:- start:1971 stop:2195 length:225 start_codon:yes stop_codon:yes gene_type:complete
VKKFVVEINVGDEVMVGKFRNVTTKIKDISLDNKGQPVITTSKGPKNLFSCRLSKLDPDTGKLTPKQIMRMKKE